MEYTLKHKDYDVAVFELERRNITSAVISKENIDRLPYSLKGILLNKTELIDCEDEYSYTLSDDGIYFFEEWLKERAMPIDRYEFIKEQGMGKTNIDWLLSNHSVSFTDCYWTELKEENLKWNDIRLKPAELSKYLSLGGDIDATKIMLDKSNASLGGQLDKYWFADENKNLYLHKKAGGYYEILSIRECFASEIYKRQNIPHTDYTLTFKEGNISGCDCKAFTDENIELIPMCDLLEEYKVLQLEDSYNLIAELGHLHGVEKQQIYDFLDAQTIVDYLISNRDRHFSNFGFLRNSETLQFIKPAPIFDSGNSKSREDLTTEGIENAPVGGMYATETENLKRVRNFDVINLSLLPTVEEYKGFLDKGHIISEKRKEEICSLYGKKIEYIRELQKQKKPYNKEYEYITKANLIRAFIYNDKEELRVSVDESEHNVLFMNNNKIIGIFNVKDGTLTGDLGEFKDLVYKNLNKCGFDKITVLDKEQKQSFHLIEQSSISISTIISKRNYLCSNIPDITDDFGEH